MSWAGHLVERTVGLMVVRAQFQNPRKEPVYVDGVPLLPGDWFTEYYFADRWYNILHIEDAAGKRKGWYCNVAQPPVLADSAVSYVDMELDLFVHPDGHYTVLDQVEFDAACGGLYAPQDVEYARQALTMLIGLVDDGTLPHP